MSSLLRRNPRVCRFSFGSSAAGLGTIRVDSVSVEVLLYLKNRTRNKRDK